MSETLRVFTELTTLPEEAAAFIRSGGIVAFPTETVYGLGSDAFDERAVAKIFEAKMRPPDNPLIAHVGAVEQIGDLVSEMTGAARLLLETFAPGPLTVVLKKSRRVPAIATAGLDTVGVRVPSNPTANEFLKACGAPVFAPSANISGRPSPTTWQAVFEDLDGRIDCILKGETAEIGLESTVVDCTADPPVVLRPGGVSIETLRAVIPEIEVYVPDMPGAPRSPGLRHIHYAPKAFVEIVERYPADVADAAFIGISRLDAEPAKALVCDSVEEYAHRVFAFFRECDRDGIKKIYCERVPETGIGVALMDRLRRAASR